MIMENTTPPKKVKERRVPKFINMNSEEYEIRDHPEMFTNKNFLVIDTPPEELEKWRKSIRKNAERILSSESLKYIINVLRSDYMYLPEQYRAVEGCTGCPIVIFNTGISGGNQRIGINAEAYLFFSKRGYLFAYNKQYRKGHLIMLKNDKIVGGIMPVEI
jgi:hypothetical protein